MKHTINYLGHEFEYRFTYSPPMRATHEDPSEPEEWEIYNPTLNGVDASDLLECQWRDFEETVIKNLKQ